MSLSEISQLTVATITGVCINIVSHHYIRCQVVSPIFLNFRQTTQISLLISLLPNLFHFCARFWNLYAFFAHYTDNLFRPKPYFSPPKTLSHPPSPTVFATKLSPLFRPLASSPKLPPKNFAAGRGGVTARLPKNEKIGVGVTFCLHPFLPVPVSNNVNNAWQCQLSFTHKAE